MRPLPRRLRAAPFCLQPPRSARAFFIRRVDVLGIIFHSSAIFVSNGKFICRCSESASTSSGSDQHSCDGFFLSSVPIHALAGSIWWREIAGNGAELELLTNVVRGFDFLPPRENKKKRVMLNFIIIRSSCRYTFSFASVRFVPPHRT